MNSGEQWRICKKRLKIEMIDSRFKSDIKLIINIDIKRMYVSLNIQH